MSVNVLENLKEQTEQLTPREKQELAEFLQESAKKASEAVDSNGQDLGLPADNKQEARRLRDKWMRENREKYGGLYVALDGDKLIGTGKNYPEAADLARKAGIKDAFVDFLPPIGYVGEMGGQDLLIFQILLTSQNMMPVYWVLQLKQNSNLDKKGKLSEPRLTRVQVNVYFQGKLLKTQELMSKAEKKFVSALQPEHL